MRSLFIYILFLWILPGCNAQTPNDQKTQVLNWKQGIAPHNEYSYHIALATNEHIYVVGGDNQGAFEKYNPEDSSWTELPAIPKPRLFHSGAIIDQSIYVTGGMDDAHQYSDKVQKFDLKQEKWTDCPPMSIKRCRMAAVSLHGKVYVIGGLMGTNDKNYDNTEIVEVFDPKTNRWTRKKDMPTARHGHCAITMNDQILVIGGYTDDGATGIVEAYHPDTDEWTTQTSMPTPRGFFGLVALDKKLYAIGGRVPQELGPIECYDLDKDHWETLPPLPQWRNRFGMVAHRRIIYIIGGEDNPGSVLIGNPEK